MAGYQTQLQSVGFSFDTLTVAGYRKIDGFCFTVKIDTNGKMYTVQVPCAVPREESVRELNDGLQQYAAEHRRTVKSAFYDGRMISICYQSKEIVLNVANGVKEAVDVCMYYIRLLGASPVCSVCGRTIPADIYAVEHQVMPLCADCFLQEQRKLTGKVRAEADITENIPMGFIGALLGGLAGAVLWVLFSMMGKIVIVAGALAAVAAYFAYQKLAKKMSKKGLILSLAIGLVMLLAGMYFAIGVDVFQGFKDAGYAVNFSEAFELIPDYIAWNVGAFLFNNIFGLVTYLAGAGICVAYFINNNKMKNRAIKLT